jgi:Abnormal spindle-like microcephaly-assoc'd, ASPM-SPD-2-Hydin
MTLDFARVNGPFGALAIFLCCLASSGCGKGLSSASLTTKGSVASQLAANPALVQFGSVAVGENASKTITVTNPGTATLTVSQASVTAGTFVLTGLTLPLALTGGQSASFSVVFAPTSAGASTSNVTLANNGSVSPLAISLSGTGTSGTGTPGTGTGGIGAPTAFSISGNISSADNGSGATVTLTGAASRTTSADASGNYGFTGLSSGSYTVTPSKTGFAFNPPNLSVSVNNSGVTNGNFLAMVLSGPIVIQNQNGTVIQGLRITSTTGNCVQVIDSTNITIQNSDIGPCSGGPVDSDAVKISSSNGVYVYDNYIHPEALSPGCCDHEDGVFVQSTIDGPVQNIVIQGNVVAYGETNIEMINVDTASVIGNFLLNPRGPFPRGAQFQCGTNCKNITVKNNYTLDSADKTKYLYPGDQYDAINFGTVDPFIVQGNFVTGGRTTSGCGLIADTGANNGQFLDNLVLNSGQCGIGIANGSHKVDGNKVYNTTPVVGGGNVAIYVGSPNNPCGPVTVTNNISDEVETDGSHNPYHSGTCQGVTPSITLGGNVFGAAADALLTPVDSVFPTPSIPPEPKTCVAVSPYSTQVGWPGCVP